MVKSEAHATFCSPKTRRHRAQLEPEIFIKPKIVGWRQTQQKWRTLTAVICAHSGIKKHAQSHARIDRARCVRLVGRSALVLVAPEDEDTDGRKERSKRVT